MAVSFEVASSAEVESNVDPVDLANGTPSESSGAPAAENSAPVPVKEVEPAVAPELLRKWEQDCNEVTKQHAITIEQTKALMVELDKQISYKTDELKSIKDEKKGAVERLIRLELRGPEMPPKPQPQKVNTSPTEAAATAESTEDTDNSWRQIPTSKIIEGVERLGTKKADAIVEAFPTLGDLEDIRGEASKAFVHFAEKLPDGIGKTIADKIEERMMDEISKYSVGLKIVSDSQDETDEIPSEDIDQETGEVITGDIEYEDVDNQHADEEDSLAGV
jgi:hypothetical protein